MFIFNPERSHQIKCLLGYRAPIFSKGLRHPAHLKKKKVLLTEASLCLIESVPWGVFVLIEHLLSLAGELCPCKRRQWVSSSLFSQPLTVFTITGKRSLSLHSHLVHTSACILSPLVSLRPWHGDLMRVVFTCERCIWYCMVVVVIFFCQSWWPPISKKKRERDEGRGTIYTLFLITKSQKWI